DDRAPEDILSGFSSAAMAARNVAELDKAYKYAGHRLAGNQELLDAATDVYGIRKDELNEVPM
ncbi:recombinase RecT, partial [Klebsiella pneumoniae]|nr:recombinase RecT [Klebsiella pneumoniae]